MAENTEQAPYTTEQLAPVREALLRRRRELIDTQRAHARDLADEQASGPVAEEEEAAARQHAMFVVAHVREGIHRELMLIDQAIAGIDEEDFGVCEECEEPIPLERLAVLPYTRLCAVDAAREERDKVARSPGRSLSL